MVRLIESPHADDLVDGALLQMVLQISPDARLVQSACDAERGQPIRRPNAGAMQHLYRTDRAGAQDHFAPGPGLEDLAVSGEEDACDAAFLDQEAIDQHVFLEPQIGALQSGFEKAAGR